VVQACSVGTACVGFAGTVAESVTSFVPSVASIAELATSVAASATSLAESVTSAAGIVTSVAGSATSLAESNPVEAVGVPRRRGAVGFKPAASVDSRSIARRFLRE
jgi:hypothetical protein